MKGWRTLGFGLFVAMGGVLQTFDWATVVPQDKTWSGLLMLTIGGAIAALRVYTSTPIGTAAVLALALGVSLFAPAPSFAADMPAPAVARKAFAAAPAATWASGFYIGANGAGAKSSAQFTMLAIPGAGDVRPSGAMAGVTLGAGAWLGGLYVGAEADGDYDFSKAKVACGFSPADCRMRDGYLLTQRVLLGATLPGLMTAAQQRGASAPAQWPVALDVPANLSASVVMPYLTGGVAERRTQACVDAVGCNKEWLIGWTAGGGVKIPLSQTVSMDIGYLYVNWNKHFNPAGAPVFPGDFHATSEHMLKAGLQVHL